MTDPAVTPPAAHHSTASDAAHGAGDHAEAELGPVDVTAWLSGLVGVAAGLAVALAIALSTGIA